MKEEKLDESYQEFLTIINPITTDSRYLELKKFIQHGNTSVYQHSLDVAYHVFLFIKKHPKMKLRKNELVRAALLHDYFLYDWHDKAKYPRKGLHGFTHPRVSVKNGVRDFNITKLEQRIIRTHMFPLTLFHIPTSREAWILSLIDKKVALKELFKKKK